LYGNISLQNRVGAVNLQYANHRKSFCWHNVSELTALMNFMTFIVTIITALCTTVVHCHYYDNSALP